MSETWDVQRDHVAMLRDVVALLAPGGTLVFSTNHRRFRLDREALADLEIEDISRRTLPRDFARNPRIHQCFLVRETAPEKGG
jgi:23S rRNA (guanine2445-N2)-methyltransferase / 23S rRNA (guanine2069-N7)-methyltransferase